MRTEFWRRVDRKGHCPLLLARPLLAAGRRRRRKFCRHVREETCPQTIARVKNEFDRIGRDTRIGVHWNWETPPPRPGGRPRNLPLHRHAAAAQGERAGSKLKALAAAGSPKRLGARQTAAQNRDSRPTSGAAIWSRKWSRPKSAAQEKIFIDDVFDEDFGLLAPGGSRLPLFSCPGGRRPWPCRGPNSSARSTSRRQPQLRLFPQRGRGNCRLEPRAVDEDLYLERGIDRRPTCSADGRSTTNANEAAAEIAGRSKSAASIRPLS